MEVPVEFGYLIGVVFFSIPWIVLYVFGKNLRKEILFMSLIIGFVSVVSGLMWWTVDWWKPETITGTRVGLEDFLMGFFAGGILTSVYKVLFKKIQSFDKNLYKFPRLFLPSILIGSVFIGTSFFNLTSFWSATVSLIVVTSIVYLIRTDLILPSLLSGLLMMAISLFFYVPIIFITPDFVNNTYLFKYLSDIRIITIPIEEFVFWFFAGTFWGAYYPFARQKILMSLKN